VEGAILHKVKGILASYRWRRRLAWLTATSVLVAGAVAVALTWPNTAPKEEQAASNVQLKVDYSAPKTVALKARDETQALAVASRFVKTAVARKDIDSSWSLVSPEFRAGFTRKEWDSGQMPVVPFPVREARWKLQYSDTEGVGFELAILPTKRSHMQAQVFLIGLHQLGAGKKRHWVVDNWQPAPTSEASTLGAGSGGPGNVLAQTRPRLSPLAEKGLSTAWLLVPLGLLSLIVLVPVGIVSVNWYRGHRAVRALQRS